MIPTVVTRTVIAAELPAVSAWAARRPGWAMRLDDTQPLLVVDTSHPATSVAVRITADLTGYRAVPPAWSFVAPPVGPGTLLFPQPGNSTAVQGSIFHSNRVICAPWNRLAYAEHGGPHGDWGALTNWTTAGTGSTKAETLADMLSQIDLHLSLSPGMN